MRTTSFRHLAFIATVSSLLGLGVVGPEPSQAEVSRLQRFGLEPVGKAKVQQKSLSLFEWGIKPKKLTAKAGKMRFTIKNTGKVGHAFKLVGNGIEVQTDVFGPKQTKTLEVELPVGKYDYWCPVPGHRENGMEGELTVKMKK